MKCHLQAIKLLLMQLLYWMKYQMVAAIDLKFQISGTSGSISSPNFPEKYPRNLTSTWYISAPPGYTISLKFHHFTLEHSKRCLYDYAQVRFDNKTDWTQIKRHCKSPPQQLSGLNSHAEIRLVTDGHGNEFSGFLMEWMATQWLSSDLRKIFSQATASPRPGLFYSSLFCPQSSRQKIITTTLSERIRTSCNSEICFNKTKTLTETVTVNRTLIFTSNWCSTALVKSINPSPSVSHNHITQKAKSSEMSTNECSSRKRQKSVGSFSNVLLSRNGAFPSSNPTSNTSGVSVSSISAKKLSVSSDRSINSRSINISPKTFHVCIQPEKFNLKETGAYLNPAITASLFVLSLGCAFGLGFMIFSLNRKRRQRLAKSAPMFLSSTKASPLDIKRPCSAPAPNPHPMVETMIYEDVTTDSHENSDAGSTSDVVEVIRIISTCFGKDHANIKNTQQNRGESSNEDIHCDNHKGEAQRGVFAAAANGGRNKLTPIRISERGKKKRANRTIGHQNLVDDKCGPETGLRHDIRFKKSKKTKPLASETERNCSTRQTNAGTSLQCSAEGYRNESEFSPHNHLFEFPKPSLPFDKHVNERNIKLTIDEL